ncbi:hypothetical protein [Pedobacter mendelii]|nr:hypothetical protein [Pedobacter mendelii]
MTIINNQAPSLPLSKVWVSANEISLAKLKSKDKEVFKSLYKFYAPAIYGLITRNIKDETKCNLVLEKTFTHAWDLIGSYDDSKCNLFIWLSRFAIKEQQTFIKR